MKTSQNITGFLLLNKALGLSSNHALQDVKRLFQAKKAGHTGTLDPDASGMLPICFGSATRFSQYLLGADKTYEFTAAIGQQTTTGDREGEIVAEVPPPAGWQDQLNTVFQQFLGTTSQIPSMYAAIKHQGRPLYEYARKGIEIERAPREITIHELTLLGVEDNYFHARVRCSKGTYVRSLVEDIAKKLSTVAHVHALHRTQVGPFSSDSLYTFDQLKEIQAQGGMEALLKTIKPLSSALTHFPAVNLPSVAVHYIMHGQSITLTGVPSGHIVRILDPNTRFLGIGEMTDGRLQPRTML